MAYHAQDGLFFERRDDGHIRIIVTTDLQPPRADGHNVEFHTTLTRSAFASVFASMTAKGETADTFHSAYALLQYH